MRRPRRSWLTFEKIRDKLADKKNQGKVLVLENGSLASYELTADSIILVTDNMKIKEGDYIAKIPKESSKTKDITGGLPRVTEMFEARNPSNPAVVSEVDGSVSFGKILSCCFPKLSFKHCLAHLYIALVSACFMY